MKQYSQNPRSIARMVGLGCLLAGASAALNGALLVSESFDYGALDATTKFLRTANGHNGGTGWAAAWAEVSTNGLRLDTAATSIDYPGATSLSSAGGQINDGFSGASQRLMTTPVDMDVAGDVYFSALVRWSGTASFSVDLRRTSDSVSRYTLFSVDSSGNVKTGVADLSDSSVALVDGEDTLIVGRLVRPSSIVKLDVAYLSVFPLSGSGQFLTEPSQWDVVHDADKSGVVLDALRITGSGNATVIDEIRMGDSYADVVGDLSIAYADFDYAAGTSLTTTTDNNGAGWTAAWATTGVSGLTTSGSGKSLYFGQGDSGLIVDGSTHVWSEGNRGNERDFTTPLPAGGTVYCTTLVRAYGSGAAAAVQMRIQLHDAVAAAGNMRGCVGIDQGTLFADGNTAAYGAGDTLASAFVDDTTYLLAMKRDGAKVYAALIPADGDPSTLAAEPVWQVEDAVGTGVTFKSLRLLTIGTTDKGIRIDELRVANTWDAAVYGLHYEEPETGAFILKAGFDEAGHYSVRMGGLSAGTDYFLMQDVDLADANVFDVEADNLTAGATIETFSDTTPPADQAFYQVTDVDPAP
jgi:hypothetical protein